MQLSVDWQNNNNSRTFVLRFKMECKLKLRGASYCTSTGRMTRVLWHIAEKFSPSRQRAILNNHRVIGIATNTSMVLSCALVSYLMMPAEGGAAGCSLSTYQGLINVIPRIEKCVGLLENCIAGGWRVISYHFRHFLLYRPIALLHCPWSFLGNSLIGPFVPIISRDADACPRIS